VITSTETLRSSNGISRNKSTRKPEPKFTPLPVGANPRILCLDGGGIRGIVQLEILHCIEHALGDHIPAQAFFDLIVGTGTGGLIAMTLSMRGQTVNTCIDQFKTICDRAFRPKMKAAAPLVRSISAKLGSGRQYRSKSLYTVLQTTFGENSTLMESPTYFTQGSRVAVTSAHAADQDPFLLANYPRPETLELQNNGQDTKLKVWESIAAAIADPAFFPPFEHDAQIYLDGGLKCGNPAALADKEGRLLWPEADAPDLFLSLGTGQHRLEVLKRLSKQPSSSPERDTMSGSSPVKPSRPTARMSRRWSIRKEEVNVDADTERAWAAFKLDIMRDGSESKGRQFVRLNPDLGKTPPAPDNRQEIEALQDNVRKGLKGSQKAMALRNIAHRLVASSFYLDARSTVTGEFGERAFSGTLACRFKYGSTQLRALGHVLRDRAVEGFEPYFLIKPDAHSKYQSKKVIFTKEIIRVMIERGIFALPAISIPLQDEPRETTINLFFEPADTLEPDGFPISGFPDVLDNQLTRQQSNQQTPRSRQRAFSHQPLNSSSQVPKSGFLSRANSTSVVANKYKRATYSHPITKATSPRVSLHDIIAEEQESGAHVERRTSQFWSYIGNKHMAQSPAELYSAEEIEQFAPNHARSSSVATDFETGLGLGGGYTDHMWSPLEARASHMSLRGDMNPP
jgi:predicted acylesterase/phospholipase RssA